VWWFIFPDGIGSASTKHRAKVFPVMVSVSTSVASSGVAALLGGGVRMLPALVGVLQVETFL
jgi:hypothetical protein